MIFIKIYELFIKNSDVAGTLVDENETLRDQMRQTEKDTIDVVTFLKKQDVDKDTEVNHFINNYNLSMTTIARAFTTRGNRPPNRAS
jgi:hypothetical protein